jgi:hypothetical protein
MKNDDAASEAERAYREQRYARERTFQANIDLLWSALVDALRAEQIVAWMSKRLRSLTTR